MLRTHFRATLIVAAILTAGAATALQTPTPTPTAKERKEEECLEAPEMDAVASARPTDPAEAVTRGLAGDALRGLTRRGFRPRVLVNGELMSITGGAHLAEPHMPVNLGLRIDAPSPEPGPAADALGSATLEMQTRREVQWSTEGNARLTLGPGGVQVRPSATDGRAIRVSARVAELWTGAPAPTLYEGTGSAMIIPAVSFLRDGDGMIEGWPVGAYPSETAADAPPSVRENARAYLPPRVFYRLDATNARASLASHVSLGDLNPPPLPLAEGETRFVATDTRLIRFWSALHQTLIERNLDAHGLTVLRGFVTPNERARLGRLGVDIAPFSRHLYGDGIAFVLDTRRDQSGGAMMDDLNADGRVDIADADILASHARYVMEATGMWGGLGVGAVFSSTDKNHVTPYVHVDLRGWFVPFREEAPTP